MKCVHRPEEQSERVVVSEVSVFNTNLHEENASLTGMSPAAAVAQVNKKSKQCSFISSAYVQRLLLYFPSKPFIKHSPLGNIPISINVLRLCFLIATYCVINSESQEIPAQKESLRPARHILEPSFQIKPALFTAYQTTHLTIQHGL